MFKNGVEFVRLLLLKQRNFRVRDLVVMRKPLLSCLPAGRSFALHDKNPGVRYTENVNYRSVFRKQAHNEGMGEQKTELIHSFGSVLPGELP